MESGTSRGRESKSLLGSLVEPGDISTRISVMGCDIPQQATDGQTRGQREDRVLPMARGLIKQEWQRIEGWLRLQRVRNGAFEHHLNTGQVAEGKKGGE